MQIDPKTQLCSVILHPAGHSLSPAMHNAAFRSMGVNSVYLAFDVTDLEGAIKGVKALDIKQVSVSVPHKVEVMKYLDEIDPVAVEIGSVNTIVNKGGYLKGYNTDIDGVKLSLVENGLEVKGKRVVLLGAGGAARTIAFVVKEMGGVLTILNRTLSKAKSLAEEFGGEFGGLEEFGNLKGDIIVNSTSVGMYPNTEKTPVTKEHLNPNMAVFDIVYNPLQTKLLKEAGSIGCKTISGMDMLVYQGARQIELWTGMKAPVDVMKEAFMEGLGRF